LSKIDDSVRKETENMIDFGSQDVQVESDSEPDNDDTPTLSLAHQIVMLNITRKTIESVLNSVTHTVYQIKVKRLYKVIHFK
jgi:hypothetical protein